VIALVTTVTEMTAALRFGDMDGFLRARGLGRLLVVGVLGVPGRGVDQPDGPGLVVDEIADPAAAGDLVFPLLEILAVMTAAGQIAPEPVLAVRAGR
jgi:hypothetical protein